jgi:hypothetical protein
MPPNPPNSPNQGDADRPSGRELGELGALAGVASPECKTAISTATIADTDDEAPPMAIMRLAEIPLDDHAEQLAAAMFANPATAPLYLRTVARTRLAGLDMYARGLLIGWERHRVKR